MTERKSARLVTWMPCSARGVYNDFTSFTGPKVTNLWRVDTAMETCGEVHFSAVRNDSSGGLNGFTTDVYLFLARDSIQHA